MTIVIRTLEIALGVLLCAPLFLLYLTLYPWGLVWVRSWWLR